MPAYRYTGDDERTYPTLGVEAAPGLVVELDAPPGEGDEPAEGARYAPQDGRWELTKTTKKAAASAADTKGGE